MNEYRSDIFLSYKNDGIGQMFAARLNDDLTKSGYRVYYNPHEKTSVDFPQKLRDAVESCQELILVVTEGCIAQLQRNNPNDWIREELLTARKAGKRIIPITVCDDAKQDNLLDYSQIDAFPPELKFLVGVDHLHFPTEPEKYYISLIERLFREIRAKKTGKYQFSDYSNANPYYSLESVCDETLRSIEQDNTAYDAMYKLALMSFFGFTLKPNNTNVDYATAARYFKLVAESDSELRNDAKTMLARMYYAGIVPGEEQSYIKAYQYHDEAAQTSSYSKTQKAFMMRIGCGCEYDLNAAMDYYHEIITEADDIAKGELALLYLTNREEDKALEVYLSMKNPPAEAKYNMGMIYKNGSHRRPPMPDYIRAAYYFSDIADTHPAAALEYGMLFFRPCGKEFRKDFGKAMKLIKHAADADIAEAQYMIGFMYERGHVTKDLREAVRYYEMAARHGHTLASVQLATLYQLSEFQNFEKACLHAKAAAECGSAEGAFLYGCYALFGRGCQMNTNIAYQYLKLAQSYGYNPADVMLSELENSQSAQRFEEHEIDLTIADYDSGDPDKAKKVFCVFDKYRHNKRALNCLGLCYQEGRGTEKNEANAFDCYRQSAAMGYRSAIFNLADCYYYGIGTTINAQEAFRLYLSLIDKQDVNKSDHDAECIVGQCYRLGIGIEKDLISAIEYLELANRSFSPKACMCLASCYKELGNEALMFNAFLKAAHQHECEAEYRVSECYRDGIGVKQNSEEAEKWYRFAMRDGYVVVRESVP